MKKNNNVLKIFGTIIVILLLICIVDVYINNNKKTVSKVEKYALGEIIKEQQQVDKEIEGYIKDKSFTFEEPKIIVNPYKLTPLTALIIFNTEKETSINVKVNDMDMTTVESTTKHAIPIYGMQDGKENVITLTDDNGISKNYKITPEKFEGDRLNVEIASEKLNDELYFLSPNFVENCIYDKHGNLLWYIKGDYAGDIEFLENGHFYISDPYQGTNGVKINYASFLEMDYLGKIYKQFITPYGYHHELVPLEDGKILTTGAKEGSPFLEAVLYIMDTKTGEATYYIDFYDYLHNIAPEWVESLGSNFDFVLNSISYDKESGDVLLSFRGIGVITRMNLETKQIKWMFGDPNNLPDEFDKYLLKVTDNTKYPYGEHSAFFTKDGNIAFHNNDADQFNMKSEKLTDYLEKYTTNVELKVDEKNKTIHTIWEYDANKKEFSKVGGILTFMANGNTLTNYGWSITQDAYENPEGISINDTNYLNGVIVELDKNNNVLFRGTTKGLIFRSYKMNLYKKNTPNYKVEKYEKINGNEFLGEKVNTESIKDELKNANEYKDEFDVQINRMMISMDMTKEDELKAVFVGEKGTSYIYTYKKAGDELPVIFNSGKYGVKINMPDGKYEVYVIKNDKYYNTNIIMEF